MDALAREDAKKIADVKSSPFSVATDGSIDYGAVKLYWYPTVVQYFCDDIGKVMYVLLAMTECTEASTGNKIFQLVHKEPGQA